jgi:amidase
VIRRVRRSELNQLAKQWNFSLHEDELDEFHALTEWLAETFDELDRHPPATVDVLSASRDPGRRPADGEDPYNAVVRWCSVKAEGAEGPLTGVRLGVKDAVAIAGIRMTAGSKLLQSFVPTRDSVVTERVLRAGAEIVAITNMDNLAFSGGGDTSAYGYTRNPFDVSRTAGGSSSGSGSVLYYDDVDIAIGCDQGGSIRVPSAWCGVVGLKPTHSLVPYVGIGGIDATYDHCGPMARTVSDAARLLEMIAGQHESDPRQAGGTPVQPYMKLVAEAPDTLRGVKIGLLQEGFSEAVGIEDAVADAVREAVERLRELGADVREVSVPAHFFGGTLAMGSFIEGMTALVASGGNGYFWKGSYWDELAPALRQGIAAFGDEFSHQMKLTLIFGTHLQRRYSGYYYAKAQNLRPMLRASYDRALADVDALLLPTTPGRPHEYAPDMPVSQHVQRGWEVLANTAPTDMTGHPALTIPAAQVDGLPVGVMLIGQQFGDGGLIRMARTYEQAHGWMPEHPGDPRRAG